MKDFNKPICYGSLNKIDSNTFSCSQCGCRITLNQLRALLGDKGNENSYLRQQLNNAQAHHRLGN